MCPHPPTAIYKSIAENPELPQAARDAARIELEHAELQPLLQKAAAATIAPPSGGHATFTCTIYSLENKETLENIRQRNGDPSKITNWKEIIAFPGIKVQDTTGFVIKGPDGNVVNDPARQLTFDRFQAVHKFYKDVFGRNSIDGNGVEIRASIHLARGYNNAYWDTEAHQMVFGDSGRFDGRGWLELTPAELAALTAGKDGKTAEKDIRHFASMGAWMNNYDIDTIGHELTHGVVQFSAALGQKQHEASNGPTASEADTLNEHIADCFAIMLKHYVNRHTAETGNWHFSPGQWSAFAMRSNKWDEANNYCRTFTIPPNIKTSPDSGAKHWRNARRFDEGGYLDPHENCGIPSHAFYLAALQFRGNTWETVGKIWYAGLTDKELSLPENQTFLGWKRITLKHAEKIFGARGKTILENAWSNVGL